MFTDIIIVGGGPSGLYASFYAGLRNMTVKIIEAKDELGGKMNIYSEKKIWDLGGLPPTTCSTIKKNLIDQGLHFNPDIIFNTRVNAIHKDNNIFKVHTDSGNVYESKVVILAIGTGIISPQKLSISNSQEFEKTNLHYTIEDFSHFRNKKVLISGGSDSAMDWAFHLADISEHVYMSFRKSKLTGFERMNTKLLEKGVTFFDNSCIKTLHSGNDNRISSVTIEQKKSLFNLDIDELIVSHGFKKDKRLIANINANIVIEEDVYVNCKNNTYTGTPGLYAIGDVVRHPAKSRLLASCINDAANAINLAKNSIEPGSRKYGIVSSHNQIFN